MTSFFRAVGLRVVDAPWDENHTVIPWRLSSRITDRWVYVLAKSGRDAAPFLYAELYFDAGGSMHVLDTRRPRKAPKDPASELLPAQEREVLATASKAVHELPIMSDILGSPVAYWAWGSPSALDPEGVDVVISAVSKGLASKYTCFSCGALDALSLHEDDDPLGRVHLPVYDPLHIASQMNARLWVFLKAQHLMLRDKPLQSRLMVARIIKGLLAADPSERSRARDEWKSKTTTVRGELRSSMDEWVDAQDAEYLEYVEGADAVAEELARFLASDAIHACEQTLIAGEDASRYEYFVSGMADSVLGLEQSEAGRAGLAQLLESQLELFTKLIAPSSPPSESDRVVKVLSAVRSHTGNARRVAKLFEVFVVPEVLRSEPIAERIANAVNAIFVAPGDPTYRVRVGPRGASLICNGPGESAGKKLALRVKIARNTLQGVDDIHGKVLAVTAIDDLFNWFADSEPDWPTRAKGLGALSDLASFASKEASLEKASKLLACVGGLFGVGLTVSELLEEREGDVKLAKGLEAAVATASVVAACIPTSPVWLGTAIALLMTGSSCLAKSLKDTPIEQFVRHSTWGRLHGHPSESQAELKDWMRGGFVQWDEPRGEVQLEALMHLMCAFTVSAATAPQTHERGQERGFPIRVDCAVLPPSSRFKVTWSGSRSVEGGVWDSCSFFVQLTSAGLRVLATDGKTDITSQMLHFEAGIGDSGQPYFVVSYPKTFEIYTVASVAYVQLEIVKPKLLRIPDDPVRYVRLRDQRDKGEPARCSVDAPHDTPVYRVWSDSPSANWMVEGQPVYIECDAPPANAVYKVAWSIGPAWTCTETYVERTKAGWRLMDEAQSLRVFSATPKRIKISFPTTVQWQLGQPVKCSVQLLSTSKVYPKLEYWAVKADTRPAPAVSSEQMG